MRAGLSITRKSDEGSADLTTWLASSDESDRRLADRIFCDMGHGPEVLYLTEVVAEERARSDIRRKQWRVRGIGFAALATASAVISILSSHNERGGFVMALSACGLACVSAAASLRPSGRHTAALLRLCDAVTECDNAALPVLVDAMEYMPAKIRSPVTMALGRILPKIRTADGISEKQWMALLAVLQAGPRTGSPYRDEGLAIAVLSAIENTEYVAAAPALLHLITSPPTWWRGGKIQTAALRCLDSLQKRQKEDTHLH